MRTRTVHGLQDADATELDGGIIFSSVVLSIPFLIFVSILLSCLIATDIFLRLSIIAQSVFFSRWQLTSSEIITLHAI